jgi:hypothetical protein
MIRYLVGSLLAAVVLFFWGFLFWGVSPIPYLFMHRFANEDEVTQVLQKNAPESGAYFLPFPADAGSSDAEAHKALLERHRKGPLVEVQYNKDGADVESPLMYVFGFGQIFLASLLVGLLLWLALPNLHAYPTRVLFVFLAGVFASAAITLAEPVWFHHPWVGAVNVAIHHLVGWLLAGLVMGLVIRPKAASVA